jgi:xylulokinase
MYLLGYDIGSSSVKASLVEASTGKVVASAFFPEQEMKINAPQSGWAEQDPTAWWENLKLATRQVLNETKANPADIKSIGISYQMHGLVMIDKNHTVIRPSIIWCDSRAVETGNQAFEAIGKEQCLSHCLNSPGNFTASKLKWVKDHEPQHFERIHKIMLPGDYIALLLTGEMNTTISGLSEGIFWDFKEQHLADFLLQHYGIPKDFIPPIVPTFARQGTLTESAASTLGLAAGTPVGYRAGDQPNNAFSLNVLNPGEIAATAGTSGVVYGVSDEIKYDPESRVNTFAHVNHAKNQNRLGVLLCVNGTGILNSWLKHNTGKNIDYDEMNKLASNIPPGAEGLTILPFGNGAERMLNNQNPGCTISNLNFNTHHQGHLYRAAQEGIVFALNYGLDIMEQTGITPKLIRAGKANMFLSPIFRETLANISGATIELYDTDGAAGAAKGGGLGAGIYKSADEAFQNFTKIETITPDDQQKDKYIEAYEGWKKVLGRMGNG